MLLLPKGLLPLLIPKYLLLARNLPLCPLCWFLAANWALSNLFVFLGGCLVLLLLLWVWRFRPPLLDTLVPRVTFLTLLLGSDDSGLDNSLGGWEGLGDGDFFSSGLPLVAVDTGVPLPLVPLNVLGSFLVLSIILFLYFLFIWYLSLIDK